MDTSFKGEGISRELSTFLSCGKENAIGYKTKAVIEKEAIVEIWCKVCAKYKSKLRSSVKGAAIQSLKTLICGMNNVTKHQVRVQFNYFRVDTIL